VILVSFTAVAMANGYNGKPYEQPAPYGSSYAPEKKHYETPSYNIKAPAYSMKAYNPPQPSYQMKAKAYNPQPSYVQSKRYDNKYEKPKSDGSYSAY
jgi:hypothetical protein